MKRIPHVPRLAVRPALGAALSLVLGACASGPSATPTADSGEAVAEQQMLVDPTLVRVKEGQTQETELLGPEEVFQRAFDAFQGRRYEEAARHYELVIAYFATTRYYLPALYNAGLTYEQLRDWPRAAQQYRRIMDKFSGEKEALDAHYRLANALGEMGEHAEVVELMGQALLRDLSHFDRLEAHVRRAWAAMETGDYKEAEQGFRTALRLNEQAPDEVRLEESFQWIARSHVGLGQVYHRRVAEIPLKLPPERMSQDLERKAELFMSAQGHYLRALRVHNPQWSVAAGYMIGRLYEDFYVDMFTAEIPLDLTEAQLGVYFEELRKQIRPLMARAIEVYERNMALSERLGEAREGMDWVERTGTHLMRLRAYLNDPWTQRRAERLARQGRDLGLLWDARAMAQDIVEEAVERARPRPSTPQVGR